MSLGLEIAIRKVSDDGASVEYTYNTPGNRDGLVRISCSSGKVVLVRSSPDDGQGLLFSRVAHKLKKHWDAGDLPDRTHWAS